ncbi:hypothetical protein [Streptomyces sp. bgisy084]|uniref:hypothetical protein n=1 Tax=unclassified Streptomyces TaxID=2593676 RepID=UPI003D72B211
MAMSEWWRRLRERRTRRLVTLTMGAVLAISAPFLGLMPGAEATTGLSVSARAVKEVPAGMTVPVGHIYVAGDSSKTLDMFRGRTGTGEYANVYGTDSSNPGNQQFKLYTMSDGSFQIIADDGNCLQAQGWYDHWNRIHPVTQESCDASSKWQLWALTPRASATSGQTTGYQLSNLGSGNCMDYLTSWPVVNSANWVNDYGCNNGGNQTWAFDSAHQETVDSLAVQYQIRSVCGGATSASISNACTYTKSREEIVAGPGRCIGKAWHNTYDEPVTESYATSNTTGYSNTYGFRISAAETAKVSPFGVGFELTLTQEFNYSHADTSSSAETFTTQVPIKPGNYGWVTLSQPVVAVTGYWTFDAGTSHAWTYPVKQKIPASSGTGGITSIATAHQGGSLPKNCSSPVDVS